MKLKTNSLERRLFYFENKVWALHMKSISHNGVIAAVYLGVEGKITSQARISNFFR